jgi:hypothetical protein
VGAAVAEAELLPVGARRLLAAPHIPPRRDRCTQQRQRVGPLRLRKRQPSSSRATRSSSGPQEPKPAPSPRQQPRPTTARNCSSSSPHRDPWLSLRGSRNILGGASILAVTCEGTARRGPRPGAEVRPTPRGRRSNCQPIIKLSDWRGVARHAAQRPSPHTSGDPPRAGRCGSGARCCPRGSNRVLAGQTENVRSCCCIPAVMRDGLRAGQTNVRSLQR